MSILRPSSGALALALTGGVTLYRADLFTFWLQDGTTILRFASWPRDLVANGDTFVSRKPWVTRSKWGLTNTMTVPELTCRISALNDSFNGGPQIKQQIKEGLFDGASMLLQRAYMTDPGDTTALGTIDLFGGVTGAVDVIGTSATVTCKGKINLLNQNTPRNIYQRNCNLAFCSAGCTLLRATFTFSFAVGASPTASFIPWAAAPGTPARFALGAVSFTSGADDSSRRTIIAADVTGLTLAYPLLNVPAPGDTFDAFQGCAKTKAACEAYSNAQHFRGFPFLPQPDTAV